jgi:hypothetical protein
MTATATPSAMPSVTLAHTATPIVTPSATLTRTPTATTVPTAAPTSTATPVVPAVVSLSPAMPVAVGVTLTVQGSNFAPGAQVVINGTPYAATWVSPSALTLVVPALPEGSYSLTVRNPDNSESAAGPALVIAGLAPTATPEPGPLVIEAVVPWPNPNPQAIAVKLSGPAERVTLKVYSVAWVLVGQTQSGSLAPGWANLDLPAGVEAKGLFYFVVQAQEGRRTAQPARGRFFRI